jgi:hypothetical protein
MGLCDIPVVKLDQRGEKAEIRSLTSKYRKNEYMRRYNTMKGANIALRIPMNMNRLFRLSREGE